MPAIYAPTLAAAAPLAESFFSSWSSNTLYLSCAVGGGAILALQMLLLLVGGDGGDGDLDVDHDASDGFGLISIRTIAAFLTFFGLMGLFGMERGWSTELTVGAALGAGLSMMLLVGWLFSLQKKLFQEGTIQPSNAVGRPAKVYLRIPGERAGKGKITVSIQSRSVEFAAVTGGPDLPTGADVRVVKMLNENTFEVEALET